MKPLITCIRRIVMMGTLFSLSSQFVHAQTDIDAIMLKKNVLCVGAMYSYDTWTNYWEGTFKRNNQNIGKISTQMIGIGGAYGVTNKLNLLFNVPYVSAKATRGTLKGLDGLQDFALIAKYQVLEKKFNPKNRLSVFAIGRASVPVTNYGVDYLPLAIGLRSKTIGLRALVDYQYTKFFASISCAYMYRSNIDIDRNAYYTTEMHYTNEVEMFDVASANFRIGYRSKYLMAEAVLDNMNTLGGFDIRKNDMPFPSNEMNATRVGVNAKYTVKGLRGLEITGGAMYTVAGRNVGQSTTISAGVFYLMNLSAKNKPRTSQQQQ